MCHECEIEAGKITRSADKDTPDHGRRRLLAVAGAAAATGLLGAPATLAGERPARSQAPNRRAGAEPRSLRFQHTHTGERLQITYAENGRYLSDALDEINRLLRDFRTGDIHPIDPGALDILHQLRQQMGGGGTYQIISAYRSPATNDMLRGRGSAVARRSLHMDGRAIDVRLTGVETKQLREAALKLQVGGVGYYPRSDFLHVDTGRVRFW